MSSTIGQRIHKCPACSRRVRSAPYLKLTDRRTRQERRYHASDLCLEAGALEAERRGPDEIVVGFYHARECGDPAGKMTCRGGCFVVGEARIEEGAACAG
jgi:hypothetical protein